ncbi:McrC family protein [Miniimonas sp. S16]|uniref:McrC family protein n=1 Tax=Miniimonas sp. S16 TaxID=2171623 RepID=UPI000D52A3BB|nr:restriction endonuclease [Miniimonas sp. S16]
MATRLELDENSEPVPARLDPTTASDLAALDLVEVRPGIDGSWLLVPRPNRVGAVRIGELDLVVRPKASFASILFMLGYARDPGFRPDMFDGSVDRDLWPMVATTLTRLAERALLRGVIQGYVTRDDALFLLRGRIRTADQMNRHHGLPLPLEVTFDEYDVDIPENRLLRTALVRMSHVARLPTALRRRLLHLVGRLEGVQVLERGTPLPDWRPTRLNAAYHPALRLADVVLHRLGLGTTEGGQPTASFIVDMAATFEDFVTAAVRESLVRHAAGVTTGQFRDHLDVGRRVPIRPDIVHSTGNQPVLVLDAKYKLGSGVDGYPKSDVYQMLAYCTALRLGRGYLVYAGSRAADARPTRLPIRNTDIEVITWPLDVEEAPVALLGQIDQLASVAAESIATC